MNDRELLEMAAKASGINAVHEFTFGDGSSSGPCTVGLWNRDDGGRWNPLVDDGDALRLAVKLNLHKAIAEAHRLVSDKTDFYAATRRAIVRAAAEIYSRSSATASANSLTGNVGGV